eukprot:jgi/Tetstr1/463772/TSEL_008588.t1
MPALAATCADVVAVRRGTALTSAPQEPGGGGGWWLGAAAALLVAGAGPIGPAQAVPPAGSSSSTDVVQLRDWRVNRSGPSSRAQQQSPPGGKQSAVTIQEQVANILQTMNDARFATDSGDYDQALQLYSSIVDQYPDLAITDYARLDRALMLFQNGNRSRAILELEDLEFSFKGSAELSAAVAAALYSERPQLLSRAENEWRIVEAFDKRYYDLEYVKGQKHWPPAMLKALGNFLSLGQS